MTARTCGPSSRRWYDITPCRLAPCARSALGGLRDLERGVSSSGGKEDEGLEGPNETGSEVVRLGVFISASILTPWMRGVSAINSLLAQRVQLNVSPTYAFPNAGGRVRRGERAKASDGAEG